MTSRPTLTFAVLIVVISCAVLWLVGNGGKGDRNSDNSDQAATDQTSGSPQPAESDQPAAVGPEQGQQDPPSGIAGERKGLKDEEQFFEEEFAEFKADSLLEKVAPLRQDIDSFLADVRAYHDRTEPIYEACISNSVDETVFSDCSSARMAFNESSSHFGIARDLEELPNVSRSLLVDNDAGFVQIVDSKISQSKQILQNIAGDPGLAEEYGLSASILEPMISQAELIQDRALSLGNNDPVRKWILMNHAELILDDFLWRTDKYETMLDRAKPSLP